MQFMSFMSLTQFKSLMKVDKVYKFSEGTYTRDRMRNKHTLRKSRLFPVNYTFLKYQKVDNKRVERMAAGANTTLQPKRVRELSVRLKKDGLIAHTCTGSRIYLSKTDGEDEEKGGK